MTATGESPTPESGDKDALSVLYTKYARRVYGFALKGCQGNTHDADEVVSETFLGVYRNFWADFAGKQPDEIEAKLFKIASRRVIDVYRSSRKLPVLTADVDALLEAASPACDDPVHRVVDRETLERLRVVLMQCLTPPSIKWPFSLGRWAYQIGL